MAAGIRSRPQEARMQRMSTRTWIIVVAVVFIINLLFYSPALFVAVNGPQQKSVDLTYSAFKAQVDESNVDSVTIQGASIAGSFKKAISSPLDTNASATYQKFT